MFASTSRWLERGSSHAHVWFCLAREQKASTAAMKQKTVLQNQEKIFGISQKDREILKQKAKIVMTKDTKLFQSSNIVN